MAEADLCEVKRRILEKYGVKSFEELWRLVEEDKVSDVNAHEDLALLDYIEYLEETGRLKC